MEHEEQLRIPVRSCRSLQKEKSRGKRDGRKEVRKEGRNREGRMERMRGYIFTSILPVFSLETEKQLEQYLKGQMA